MAIARSLRGWIGVGVIWLYSRCAKLGRAEADPSVASGHMVLGGCALWTKTNVNGHGWTSTEALGNLKRT